MSNGGFTAVHLLKSGLRRAQTTKNPSQAVPEMGSFGKIVLQNQIRNSFPKAHSLLEAPPPDLVELAVAVH
jgi:hypothetical protein